MFAELDQAQRELLARALDSFVGDVAAGVIPGVTVEQAEKLKAAVFPEVPTARLVDGQLFCGHEGCEYTTTVLEEHGYTKGWGLHDDRGRFGEEGGFTAVDNGLGAFSDDGCDEFVVICGAGHRNDVPDGVFEKINWQ